MPRLDGGTHVNLTVSDLERSSMWYQRVFGFVVVNDVRPPGARFRFQTLLDPRSLSSVVLGQADDPVGGAFDETRVGLHHLGYHVPERSDLFEWAAHLDTLGVENSGVREHGHESGAEVWFRDPDNIFLEISWVNRAFFMDRLRQRWREARKSGKPESWVSAS